MKEKKRCRQFERNQEAEVKVKETIEAQRVSKRKGGGVVERGRNEEETGVAGREVT